VTQSEKSRGNISSVKAVAEKKLPGIPIYQPEKATDPLFIQEMKNFQPDLFVVAAYGKVLRQPLLEIPSKGAINVHTSLLPKYRGAAPIQRAIMNGEKITGVTIMMMTAGLDSGDIIATKELPLDDKISFGELQDNLREVAGPILLNVLKMFERGAVKTYPQDESLATYAPKITPEDLNIDFNKDAFSIHNLIRALSPLPGARCSMKIKDSVKTVKIIESDIVFFNGQPGEILKFEKEIFLIGCKKNAIAIKKLQVEGKKVVTSGEFISGIHGSIEIV
jgi:methionyl-tRNA formyltransferase